MIKKFSLLLLLGLTGAAHANINVSIYAGAAATRLSGTQQVAVSSDISNQYSTNPSTEIMPALGVDVAYQWNHPTTHPFDVSLGFGAYYFDLGEVNGIESPYINAGNFDTLDYHYAVTSVALMLEPKIIYSRYAIQPYIMGGVGYALNNISGYNEWPSPGSTAAPVDNLYNDHTEGAFAWEGGAGAQYVLGQNNNAASLVSLEYRYVNLGNARLDGFSGQTTASHLTQYLQTSTVVLGFTVQFK